MARSRRICSPAFSLGGDVVGLGLSLGDDGFVGVGRGGDENLAEAHLLGLRELVLVSVVVGLFLGLGDLQMTAYLVADDLLGKNAVLDVGLEVLEGDALLTGGLLEVFHGVQVVLLADLVEPADDLGVGVEAQSPWRARAGAAGRSCRAAGSSGARQPPSGLAWFCWFSIAELLLAALKVAATDDLVVHADDHVLDHDTVRSDGGWA